MENRKKLPLPLLILIISVSIGLVVASIGLVKQETAKKTKSDGVGHFVFLSSMSVYGMDAGEITLNTKPEPVSNYGKSKLQAEKALFELEDNDFKVAALRPPMVYGKNCRGNFQLLLLLVTKSPVFPAVNNRRSMISITNLSAFIKLIVDGEYSGIYCPQNKEYVNTTDMAKYMAKAKGRKVFFSKLAGFAIKMMIPFVSKAKKAFATLIYKDCEQFDFSYCVEELEDSINKSI